ncbi:histidine kinase [Arenibacter sp. F20364]|uniref:sensor histidine kinase n=1 Tax=Arenibacter sp. F20364 TaxID=2926415 RepID=UPI001FF425A7|nr:histidine kinase [Arenibacter sp. F20364]MCK0192314.1 histidine kinase [Arenibacter sp. F20364]
MDKTKRFLFHTMLWLAVWLMAWLLITDDVRFAQRNAPSFLLQILVVAFLIYYTAPALLFKKKYVSFIIVSMVLIVICAAVISDSFRGLVEGPPPREMGPPPKMRPIAPPQFLINFLVLSIAYVLATFVETFLFAQKKEEETIRNKNENLQTELKLLKSQINPHFLFNSLNNIYALSVTNSDKTQKGISTLSNMLRYVLYECEQPFVPLSKEIDYIKDYLAMYTLKSSKTYPIHTEFQIANPAVQVAPMLFIPFVENALKHGNLEKISDAFLKISIFSDDGKIDFEIENSTPKEPLNKDKVGGIGLENVKKRLELLYPKKHTLTIQKELTTFKVQLHIGLDENH